MASRIIEWMMVVFYGIVSSVALVAFLTAFSLHMKVTKPEQYDGNDRA